MTKATLYIADAQHIPLPDNSVHCVVTSPPYWGLRSYRIDPVAWPDGWVGDLGMETSVEMFIDHLVEVFREVRRVLHPTGTVWVNLGDSYYEKSTTSGGLKPLDLCGVPERFALALQADGWWWRDKIAYCKTSVMPESQQGWRWERCKIKVKTSERVALEGSSRGGKLRLTNPKAVHYGMAPDMLATWADCPGCPKCAPTGGYILRRGAWRTTRAWEYILMFTKTGTYFCDSEAVKEEGTYPAGTRAAKGGMARFSEEKVNSRPPEYAILSGTRNPRSWWVIGPEPCNWDFCLACGTWYGQGGWSRKAVKRWTVQEVDEDGEEKTVHHARCANCQAVDEFVAHYALFPPELPKRCILAATSAKGVCPTCGAQWAPVVEHTPSKFNVRVRDAKAHPEKWAGIATATQAEMEVYQGGAKANDIVPGQVVGWRPTCACPAAEPVPATVLDPFMGTGTTGVASLSLGRHFVGVDISRPYVSLAAKRIEAHMPLFNRVIVADTPPIS